LRETREEALISGSFIDNMTGEVSNISMSHQMNHRNYSIKRLNMKIWFEAYEHITGSVCNSGLDIKMLSAIKQSMNSHNEFRGNVTEISKTINTTPANMRKMIKKLVDIKFMYRLERGVYLINPFIIKAKGMTNERCESLQDIWRNEIGEPHLGQTWIHE